MLEFLLIIPQLITKTNEFSMMLQQSLQNESQNFHLQYSMVRSCSTLFSYWYFSLISIVSFNLLISQIWWTQLLKGNPPHLKGAAMKITPLLESAVESQSDKPVCIPLNLKFPAYLFFSTEKWKLFHKSYYFWRVSHWIWTSHSHSDCSHTISPICPLHSVNCLSQLHVSFISSIDVNY